MARVDWYGVDFTWYAVDTDGHVAQFTAGYAPIPTAVFVDETLATKADEYFDTAPETSAAQLARGYRLGASADASAFLRPARRGLFLFSETGAQGNPTYRLVGTPSKPVLAETLAPNIKRAVTVVRFDLHFFRETIIVPSDHVPCST